MASAHSLHEIIGYFEEVDWPIEEIDEAAGRVFTYYRGENVVVDLEAALHRDWRLLQLTLSLPEFIPVRQMPQAMAVINRINCNLPVGHFEIEPESRQVTYYLASPISPATDLRTLFEQMLAWAVDIVDQEHPHLMEAIYSAPAENEGLLPAKPPSPRRFDA